MAEETMENKDLGPKKRLSKQVSIAVMVTGGLLILIPWFFFPVEQGSTAQIVKTVVGVSGFCILCAGAYFRP
ncbi:MAG: hypothetical protein ACE147_00120 [Candidatus Methylomirabilales bacterium]